VLEQKLALLGHNIPDAIDAAYEEIDLECKHKYKKVGSTALVAYINEDSIWMSNVGDTRAVLCHRSRPVRLSYDHKAKDEAERQRVLDEGGSFGDAPDFRLSGVLSVTRAFGDADCGNYLRAVPFISEHKLHPDDDYLVMASDGLWDVFTDADIVRFINDEIEVRGNTDPQRWAKLLAEEAMKLESKDNISIIIVVLNERSVIELSKSPLVLQAKATFGPFASKLLAVHFQDAGGLPQRASAAEFCAQIPQGEREREGFAQESEEEGEVASRPVEARGIAT